MQKQIIAILLAGIWFLTACRPAAQPSQPATLIPTRLPTTSHARPSPAASAESLSEIIWVSDPDLPQYDPDSPAFAQFPGVVDQIASLGADAMDAADDLAVALRYPRPDAYLAAQALLKLGPGITATTIPLLKDNLRRDQPGTRLYSLVLLASLGDIAACAVGEIAPLLWDPDPRVRTAAALALEKITAQDLLPAEVEILITPSFTAALLPADSPPGQVVEQAREWWDEQGSQVNWHPVYGICDP